MATEVIVTYGPHFKRELKPLAKKFASLPDELEHLATRLAGNPRLGTSLGKDCYKIRLAVRSKGGGKSGGMRIITYVVVRLRLGADGVATVYLASIYEKSERENITDAQLKALIAALNTSTDPNP
jgi:hypothetical protein